jgi:hypothetical protein
MIVGGGKKSKTVIVKAAEAFREERIVSFQKVAPKLVHNNIDNQRRLFLKVIRATGETDSTTPEEERENL